MPIKKTPKNLNTESYKELRKRDKQKVINNQNEMVEANILIRQAESQKIQEYKANLPQFLKEKNEKIMEEVKKILAAMEEKPKFPMEPVVMRLLNRELAGMGQQPIYTARELSIVFEAYQDMVQDLLLQGVPFIPSRQNFSAFAGINAGTFESSYLKSNDLEKAKIAATIEDYFIECSWSGAKQNKLNSYAVEKYNKLRGIGGGYVEPKVNLEIKQSNISIDSPEAMQQKIEELKKSLLDIDNN